MREPAADLGLFIGEQVLVAQRASRNLDAALRTGRYDQLRAKLETVHHAATLALGALDQLCAGRAAPVRKPRKRFPSGTPSVPDHPGPYSP